MNSRIRRRGRRLAALVAGLAVAAFTLSGCLYSLIPEAPAAPTESKTPDTDGVDAALLPFYGQELDWTGCAGGFDCTTVTAPLDWSDPAAGEIELAVIRHRATSGDAMGSLLRNPGGPGASGVAFVRDSLEYAFGEPLLAHYDAIGFDPRGVGDSTAVRCFDTADMDSYLFDIADGARGSDEWTENLRDRHARFAAACDEASDGILPYITTENAARDMDLLRAVLGDEKLSYLGSSYGTFLGATYAKLYPDKVGRFVLDGAVDPAVPRLEISTTQGIGFESALRAYMQWCLDGEDCPFRGTVDDAMSDLGTLLASVDRSPLEASDGRLLGADSLRTGIVAALYSEASWPYLSIALNDVLQGGADSGFILTDFYYNRVDGEYLDNSTEAFRAYNCMDYPDDGTDADVAAAEALLADKAPTVAPYWSGPDACADWAYPPTGVRAPIAAEGAAPIVVVGTTNDPATPYEWAVSLADQLSSGVLLTRVGEGHGAYNRGSECIDAAIETYLIDGVVPDDGTRCE